MTNVDVMCMQVQSVTKRMPHTTLTAIDQSSPTHLISPEIKAKHRKS